MEILILIIGLFVFFESDSKDIGTAKNIKTGDINQVVLAKNEINQNLRFEIINKNGVWVFVNKNKIQRIEKIQTNPAVEFITLPDGSKIEKGI